MDARDPLEADWPLVSAAEMRSLDRFTIEQWGVPGDLLMESAGRAVAAAVLEDSRARAGVLVLCGSGNNGGDGFAAARHLAQQGLPVEIHLVGDASRVAGDARLQLERARAQGLDPGAWRAPEAGVVVDALFGTGLSREVSGDARRAIESLRALRSSRAGALGVISVDLPSGICADTGRVLGAAVAADRTISIELPKLGLALEPGRGLAGRCQIARIGIAHRAPDAEARAWSWTPASAGRRLPPRPAVGHKGSFGHVLLAAGSEGKSGAAALAATAAGRAGAGLVTLACPAALREVLAARSSESMTAPLGARDARHFAAQDAAALLALAEGRDVLGLGPGLGREATTSAFAREVALAWPRALALDADGLFAFAREPERLRARGAPTVLTPHPGEAALLLCRSAAELNADRLGAARELAQRTGAVVVLKGAATVTAEPQGRAVVNPTGGPALGSGGTGDVLLGIVTALLGQGLDAFVAAALGAYLHGYAGDRISLRQGSSGLLAGDLLLELPGATQALREAAALVPELSLARRFP